MFSYQQWRAWLQAKLPELQSEGVSASLRHGPDDGPKPRLEFGLLGRNAMGSFENWNTGETDYTVMAPASPDAKMVSHKWMLVVTDETFEEIFNEFVAEFRKHNH